MNQTIRVFVDFMLLQNYYVSFSHFSTSYLQVHQTTRGARISALQIVSSVRTAMSDVHRLTHLASSKVVSHVLCYLTSQGL